MKSFAAAIVIMISIVVLITVNSLYINNTVNEVISQIDTVKNSDEAKTLCIFWEERLKLIKYSVNKNETEKLTSELYALVEYCKDGMGTEASASVARARVYAEALKQKGL